MMENAASTLPVLSRPLAVDTVPSDGLTEAVIATPAEREVLRALNGLVGLGGLRAALTVRRQGRDGLRVTGEVVASIVQTCVASLDTFESELRESVEVRFLQPAALERWRADHAGLPDDEEQEDEPDCINNGRIDLGALVAEHLTLGLDPYPKKPGVSFAEPAPPAPDDDVSPFAALKALRSDNS